MDGLGQECLLDTARFGLEARMRGLAPGARERLIAALGARGWLTERPVGGRVKLRVPFDTGRVEGAMQATLLLRELEADGQTSLVIGNGSEVRLSALELLRAHLGDESCGPAGLDGGRNVVGSVAGRAGALLETQLGFVRAGLDALADAIVEAFDGNLGEVVAEGLWLRTAEVTADLEVEGSVELVRSLQRAALSGSTGVVADLYRVSSGSREGAPAVRWFRTRGGPVAKVHPKLDGLARVEVSFPKRPALKGAGTGSSDVGGDEAVGLVRELLALAGPLLAEVVRHVRAAAGARRRLAALVLELAPLARLAEGVVAGRGRRPSAEARRTAAEALDALLTTGAFSAPGLRINSAPWAVLKRLTEDGGPLVRWPGSHVYTVRAGG